VSLRAPGADRLALLAPVTFTGIVNTAPWQELSEALLMLIAFASVRVVVAPAATSTAGPVWCLNFTPVEASQAAPLSEVIAEACFATEVIRTGNGFGFVTFSFTDPVAPG